MRHAVQNRAADTVRMFDAMCAALGGRLRSAAAKGKSYTTGKRLERAWRTHTLLSPLEFYRADSHGLDSFAPIMPCFKHHALLACTSTSLRATVPMVRVHAKPRMKARRSTPCFGGKMGHLVPGLLSTPKHRQPNS